MVWRGWDASFTSVTREALLEDKDLKVLRELATWIVGGSMFYTD